MGRLLVQFLGLLVLLGLVAWGYRHWISPRQVDIHGKGMLLLTVVTLVGGLLGSLALFVTDSGPSGLIWVWPGDLLTSRLIAVMLLTIAVGAVYALQYADVSRVMLGVIAVYGFGVMLANLWNILANKPVSPSYVAVFGIMFLVSTSLLLAER
jgi:hypothetical protein